MQQDYPELNFPAFTFKIESREGEERIWDEIRKKWISLTKEEWVRQHVSRLLTDELGYPKSLIRIESQLKYWKKQKRSDILVYDTDAKPWLLVECKRWDWPLGDAVLHQIATYNKTLQAPFISISNGMQHFCWQQKGDRYDPLKNFPPYY